MTTSFVDVDALRAVFAHHLDVEEVIGIGGQRAVFRVRIADQVRVLKLMPAIARERAEREVRIGCRFDHPGLARILDDELREITVDAADFVYFTEELIPGVPLSASAELASCEVLDLIAQLIDASEHLYTQHRVVHRDIKPPNIMRQPDGQWTLLDVGVGRHQDLTTLTAAGADHGPGTPGYLAPEQLQAAKGHELDWRTDQFAIGIVGFEQLTGRLPFDPNRSSYRTLLTTGTISSWSGVPEEVLGLLQRLLHPKPHFRFRLGRAAVAVQDAKERAGC